MVLGIQPIVFISLFVIFVWVISLTVLLLRMIGHYNKLGQYGGGAGLKEVLEHILRKQSEAHTSLQKLENSVIALARDGELHVQRIGLVRFNPFADTGGAQSFTMAILDRNNSGVVMTSLYGRTGNRWYVKEVAFGKGKEVELSKEEESAIKNAKKV